MPALRCSSGLAGAPATDMYINVQCKTSWSALGAQIANLAPTLLKPISRGRVSLTAHDAPPCVEFNFTGHELDLARFKQGFRLAVEVLAHENVRAMSGVTFPVKFDDRLRHLNRITPANRIKSTLIAALIDLVPALAGRHNYALQEAVQRWRPALSEFERDTQQGERAATKATAHLPGLTIEIVHRQSPGGDVEHISVNLQAVLSFAAFGRHLEAAN